MDINEEEADPDLPDYDQTPFVNLSPEKKKQMKGFDTLNIKSQKAEVLKRKPFVGRKQ